MAISEQGINDFQKAAHLDMLRDTFTAEKPLAKLTRSESGYYLYDTGTNKILACREEVFDLLQSLFIYDINKAQNDFVCRYGEKEFLAVANEITQAINEENILRVKNAAQFGLSNHFLNFQEILESSVQSIHLEITQSCTLACTYCPYNDHYKGKRNHGEKKMYLNVALKAIEFLQSHSSQSDFVAIGFYGGEPLMEFPLIKKCVEYADEIFQRKKLLFTMTTNATLITPAIAEYLLKNDFSIMVSLDGPEEYHDAYRKDMNGNGSFQRTIKGLRILADKYVEIKKGKISINMVYTPPYSKEKLDRISGFLKGIDWLPEINVITGYPGDGTLPVTLEPGYDLKQDKDLMQWSFEHYWKDYERSIPMVKGYIEKKLAKLMQRPVFKEPAESYFLNACCLPGQRKNFISPEGDIHICEKITTYAPAIGNVMTGFDYETIKKVYIDDYAEASMVDCSHCWGLRLCDICYVAAFADNGKFDLNKKSSYCNSVMRSLERLLAYFVSIMEENPGGLDYLYRYELQ